MFGPSLQDLGRELVNAARNGKTEEVIALLDQGADIEATSFVVRHVKFIPIARMVFVLHI